jgi:hypothetical protein
MSKILNAQLVSASLIRFGKGYLLTKSPPPCPPPPPRNSMHRTVSTSLAGTRGVGHIFPLFNFKLSAVFLIPIRILRFFSVLTQILAFPSYFFPVFKIFFSPKYKKKTLKIFFQHSTYVL